MVASDVEVGIGRLESAIEERSSAKGSGASPSVVAIVVVVVSSGWSVCGSVSNECLGKRASKVYGYHVQPLFIADYYV